MGSTDMRKAINGVSVMVSEQMKLDLFSGHLFVFCNRQQTILKILALGSYHSWALKRSNFNFFNAITY